MQNFKLPADVELSNKNSANALTIALATSAAENQRLYDKETQARKNGVFTLSSRDYDALLQSAKCQREIAENLSDSLKATLAQMFGVKAICRACINSYSLFKLPSIAMVLKTGDWQAHTEMQVKVVLAKAIDADSVTDQSEWEKMFTPVNKLDRWDTGALKSNGEKKTIAKSPTQQNQCDTLFERLGLTTRHRDGGKSVVRWEKTDHKFWAKIESIFDAQFAGTGE